eukprot:365588-Chlamydomonas_euryale.AAC.9
MPRLSIPCLPVAVANQAPALLPPRPVRHTLPHLLRPPAPSLHTFPPHRPPHLPSIPSLQTFPPHQTNFNRACLWKCARVLISDGLPHFHKAVEMNLPESTPLHKHTHGRWPFVPSDANRAI